MLFKLHIEAIDMKKSFAIPILLLTASFILPSCEKAAFDYSPQMEEFYTESKGLSAVTIDSVTLFENKVDGFVTTHPPAKEHKKYPLILDNIRSASFGVTVTCDTTWAGHIYENY